MQSKRKNIIYGRHPVIDVINSGKGVDKVLLQQGIRGEFEKEIRKLTKEKNVALQYVPKERLNKIAGGNHQGILAYLSLLEYQTLENILPFIYEKSETPLILVLDGVTDVRNMGAIARSAECLGAHALVIPATGSAQINAEAMKSSAGALGNIAVCREKNLSSAINYLKMSGIKIFASSLHADKTIFQQDFSMPCAIIIGSEDDGVSPAILRRADERFIIPQSGESNSLNVSVATGIMLYEVVRQRNVID